MGSKKSANIKITSHNYSALLRRILLAFSLGPIYVFIYLLIIIFFEQLYFLPLSLIFIIIFCVARFAKVEDKWWDTLTYLLLVFNFMSVLVITAPLGEYLYEQLFNDTPVRIVASIATDFTLVSLSMFVISVLSITSSIYNVFLLKKLNKVS